MRGGILAAAALLVGCATPQVAFNPRADFSRISRVTVAAFAGPQGDAAAELMTQSLVAHGADVVERRQLEAILQEQRLSSSGFLDPATIRRIGRVLGVDAIFMGTVVQSVPEQSYLVTGSRRNVVTGVTPVGRGHLSPGLPVLGIPDSQVVTSAAAVSLVARMVDVETGSILWAGSMSYESLDTASAMRVVARALVESLVPIWPDLRRPR